MAAGRPSIKTKKLTDEIIDRIAEGESLVKILKSDRKKFPVYSTVMKWLTEDKEFSDMYAKAKEIQADYLAEELLDIADDGTNDWMERHDKENPGWVFNGEHYQRSRLRVDTRKWIASKLKPRKYGERTTLTGDPENPIHLNATTIDLKAMTDEQLDKFLAGTATKSLSTKKA